MIGIVWSDLQNLKSKYNYFKYLKCPKLYISLVSMCYIAINYTFFSIFLFQPNIIYRTNKFVSEATGTLYTKDNIALDMLIWESNSNIDLIYFHGSRIKQKVHFIICDKLRALDVNVISVFHRGYGGSSGKPSEIGIMLDVDAILTYVVNKRTNKRFIAYGQSMGSFTALYFMLRMQQFIADGGLINSPGHAIRDKNCMCIGIIENPVLNFHSYLRSNWYTSAIRFLSTTKWQNDKLISRLNFPVLILLSEDDQLVDNKNGTELANMAPSCELKMLSRVGRFNANMHSACFSHMRHFI